MANGFNWTPYLTGGAARPDAISGLNPQFSANLARMISEAPPEIQAQIKLTSAYRSPERQAEILSGSLNKRLGPAAVEKWNGYVANAGGDVVAAGQAARPWLRSEGITRWVAPPGSSNHQKGEAVDFKYLDPTATKWAHENAPKYGLNFPMSNEDWHIEPAGIRGGGNSSAGSMVAQMQNKSFDPVNEVMTAGGNPTGDTNNSTVVVQSQAPQAVAGAAGATDSASAAPAAADKTIGGMLGIDVPKGLPSMLNFAAMAMDQQQPQDSTPQGGLLRSQPVEFQVAQQMLPKQTFKPWEMYSMFGQGRA